MSREIFTIGKIGTMDRMEKIRERRRQIPKKYQGIYDRSLVRGNLRDAINAQCLMCVGWVSEEVRFCTDLACPLYVHRKLDGKYCTILQSGEYDKETSVESTNSIESVKLP